MSAIVGLARKLKFGGAVHSGSRMMDWCVSNAKEEKGRQSVMIVKDDASTAKIDPLVALFNATKMMERTPDSNGPSVYDLSRSEVPRVGYGWCKPCSTRWSQYE